MTVTGAVNVDEPVKVMAGEMENGFVPGLDPFIDACRRHWPVDQGRVQVVTRAPGRLDCMGGMADFSGALALQMPIARAAFVAAGRRDDQKVVVQTLGWEGDGPCRQEWPLALLYRSDGEFVTPNALAEHFSGTKWVRHIAGVCLSLLESGLVPHFAGGITLLLQADIPICAGLASSAAIQMAAAKAIVALFEAEITDQQLLSACRLADVEVVGAEPGLVDHHAILWGQAGTLLQIRCQPDEVLGYVALPKDVKFVAVDCGVRHDIYRQRYADNRVSSLLGRFLIERLLRESGEVGDPTGGYLANISPSEYVRRFRNELPVKLRGRDFLAEVGQPGALEVVIESDRIYKVRSRTEHHIYENDRTHRFIERLARVRRTGDRDVLVEAGDLMYASHWSYGQRCGMGSIETDVLVNMIRERGAPRGLFGAKVTAGGCGGAVAVLMADKPGADAALEEACAAYAAKTGKQAVLLAGSSPGAAAFGARVLE